MAKASFNLLALKKLTFNSPLILFKAFNFYLCLRGKET